MKVFQARRWTRKGRRLVSPRGAPDPCAQKQGRQRSGCVPDHCCELWGSRWRGGVHSGGRTLYRCRVGGVAAALSIRGTLLGKVVRDPPRDDFRQQTEPAESRLDLDPLRESPFGEPAIGLIAAVDETNRLLDAMVTALERASGAELANDLDAAEARLGEAYRFAESASVGFRNSSAGGGSAQGGIETVPGSTASQRRSASPAHQTIQKTAHEIDACLRGAFRRPYHA